ncbi:GNAT family N-acetyltransferase [Kribbella italica]|uniref:GNAT superfamily N-acetyltransferase n=1 Tax=Kribbella italica TaxID=1540520 RepID=A0A7W9J364_9ACTN|nr:GNAT family N-acetyltransferase [Kribbella italica]MBB5834515.1 GNAT superfamily N-acetyltransferase [Kribbella italica]
MTAALPAGLTVQPAELADAAAITAQMAAYTTPMLGFPKHSYENVADYLRDPAIELASGSWLVHDGDELVGSATAVLTGARPQVDLDVFAADPAVAAWLFATASARAVDLARTAGLPEVKLHFGQLEQDATTGRMLADAGFDRSTAIHLMRINHTTPAPAPEPPAGVKLQVGAFDDATKRAAHRVIAESFATQPGAVPRPYDEWVASRESRSAFDWSQLTVAELDGEAVGVRECGDQFVSSDNCNYIGRLGVLESARGRGLAKFLLRDQFARDAAAGRTGTTLHVDTNNPTPALGLYLSVGMRPTVVTHIWEKQIALTH